MNDSSAKRAAPGAADLISASPGAELAFAPDLTIAACNEAYAHLCGVSGDTLIGRPIRQAFHGGAALEKLIASLESVLRSRRPNRLAAPTPTPLGGRPFASAMINMPMLDSDGGVKWIVHSLENAHDDDHDRPAMALALEAAEARLRSIMQTVPDAMIIIDDRGRIESLSTTAERLFGYSMAELAGRNVSQLMPSPDRERHDAYLERYLATGERRIIGIGRVVVGQRKDGTTFPMHLTVGELRSAERHYFTGFIRDLTDQQLTESRLKELQSEITHM